MLREAELFVMAEQMLVEVLGRIRAQDQDIVLPPMYGGAARPMSMSQAVQRYAREDALVPAVLDGRPAQPEGQGGPAGGPDPGVPRIAAAACAAAGRVTDGDAVVHGADGDLPARDYLLRTTVARSLLAHYVAAFLGSTACPLPEELARPLWELTAPEAPAWRRLGYFRDPMPLPENVSWRDRFLLTAGHQPHPLGH